MENLDDHRPRRRLHLSTAIVGRILGWRWHAPTAFYGLGSTRTVELISHVHDSAGDRWRVTLAGDRDQVLDLVTAVQEIGARAHTLPADELRAAVTAAAGRRPGARITATPTHAR